MALNFGQVRFPGGLPFRVAFRIRFCTVLIQKLSQNEAQFGSLGRPRGPKERTENRHLEWSQNGSQNGLQMGVKMGPKTDQHGFKICASAPRAPWRVPEAHGDPKSGPRGRRMGPRWAPEKQQTLCFSRVLGSVFWVLTGFQDLCTGFWVLGSEFWLGSGFWAPRTGWVLGSGFWF